MMNEKWSGARARYEAAPVPEELNFAVAAAVRAGGRERKRRRVVRRSLATLASCCACFVLLVNVSPVFARAVYEMPVLGSLARVVTVTQYAIEDKNHLIDVRLPALENTGNTDLEQRINLEIQTRINGVLAEAEDRARQTREAYMATGGAEEDFIPIIISVDYEIKCQNERCLSFILTRTYWAPAIGKLPTPPSARRLTAGYGKRARATSTVPTAWWASRPSPTASSSTSTGQATPWCSLRSTRLPPDIWAPRSLRSPDNGNVCRPADRYSQKPSAARDSQSSAVPRRRN